MQRLLSLLSLVLLTGLASFVTSGPPEGRIEFRTPQGEQVFTCNTVPVFYNETSNQLNFYFKPASFTTGNKEADDKLFKLTQCAPYGILEFKGTLEKKPANLGSGQRLNTAAVGKLTFAGRTTGLRVPVTITNEKGKLTCNVLAAIDWEQNPTTRNQGKELGVQGPIRVILNHSL